MTHLRQMMRSMRHRWSFWFQSFSYSNVIVLVTVCGIIFLFMTIQGTDDVYNPNFMDSGSHRYISPPPPPPVVVVMATGTSKHPHLAKKKPKSPPLRDNITKQVDVIPSIPVSKFMPAIKVFYHPKNPRIQQLKKNLEDLKAAEKSGVRNEVVLRPTISKSKGVALGKTAGHHGNRSLSSYSSGARIEFDQWLRVNPLHEKHQILVYSAYWDDRFDKSSVRVMAIMATKNSPSIYCRLMMTDGTHVDVTASKKVMNEHWRLLYSSYFVSCDVSKDTPPPTKISISTDLEHAHAAVLPVRLNRNDVISPRGQLAVCVKPLHYNYDRASWLLEFVEFHRLLGVDHFFFYNHTVGPNVDAILRSYVAQGVVSVLPWQLNIKSQKEIRTEGIFSSLNDCLFRTMYLFRYAIMLDFDEYIVPREHDTYGEMLQQLEGDNKKMRGNAASFVFRNTFFYLYWENDTTGYGVEPEKPPDFIPYLLTQYKTRRLNSSMKPGSRSKYIVVPERALEVGNHVVWRHTSGSRPVHVPDTMALLHHYRICEFGGYACLKKPSVIDQVAQRFGTVLLDRVRHQCELTFLPEGKCPLSPPLGSPW